MSVSELLIVGAGGFARETAHAVAALNAVRPAWRLLGFLDDDPLLRGRRVDGLPVLGGTDLAQSLTGAQVLVCVGNPRNYFARARIVERLALPADRYATIIHPSADVCADASIGPGTVLLAQAVLTAAVTVGAHVAVMPHAVLTHDVTIDDFATIASGVRFGGGSSVARGAYLGSGALIREQVEIGAWAQVGMGSVVLGDVPGGQVWVGNPARRLRDVEGLAAFGDSTSNGRLA
ncbi:acetyltransferase [Actinocrinis puniceicyclus]|uniref:Acetyltransferase n=1 Tax=Actinocrinis puniceicyclus TaxID=977794 RepID=A0A8J8BFE5_9ACTN|nr:acetyltransferase [Actinocrinis puniceicyclus]MBS2966096.1 acetyltransferase [Actinocrinis puniceicyclus]